MNSENETTGYTKALKMFPVVNEKSVPPIREDLAALDEAQKKLQVIFALVEFYQHFAENDEWQEMCKKIMELKDKEDV